MAEFLYCFDCNMLDYAMTKKGGKFDATTACPAHVGHKFHVFGNPEGYAAPVRNILRKLHLNTAAIGPGQLKRRDLEISRFEMEMFRLSLALDGLDGIFVPYPETQASAHGQN